MESPPPPPVVPSPPFVPVLLPPVPNKDASNLRLLAIFHYILAGLAVPFLGFLALHYTMMRMVFGNPKMWENQKNPPPFNPEEFFGFFQWIYLFAAVVILAGSILTFISGRFIARRTHRTFSLVMAGLNCLHFPLGIALGVFTLVVLTKESVARLYAEAEAPGK